MSLRNVEIKNDRDVGIVFAWINPKSFCLKTQYPERTKIPMRTIAAGASLRGVKVKDFGDLAHKTTAYPGSLLGRIDCITDVSKFEGGSRSGISEPIGHL